MRILFPNDEKALGTPMLDASQGLIDNRAKRRQESLAIKSTGMQGTAPPLRPRRSDAV